MSNLLTAIRTRKPEPVQSRYSLTDYLNDVLYTAGGIQYQIQPNLTQPGKKQPPILAEYQSMVGAFKGNGPVFSTALARATLFKQAEFKFKNLSNGKLFGSPELSILETPWPNGTTSDLLMLAEWGATFGGQAYFWRDGNRFRFGRPDWVTIVLASSMSPDAPGFALDAEIVGYIYTPQGVNADLSAVPKFIPVQEMVHWTPIPDPTAPWRGMSWLTPVVREITADNATTDHKVSFFENGATPNLAVKFPESVVSREQFEEIRDSMENSHAGARNAYRTLYLAAGADVQVVGVDFQKMDYRSLQGAGEVRIANAGQVPPSVIGLVESLTGTPLNAGNFAGARRQFADGFAAAHWQSVCSAFAKAVAVPSGSKLWYTSQDIPYLREDQEILAKVQQAQATAVQTHIFSGFDPDVAVQAVLGNDLGLLVGGHTGMLSVQLQPPMSEQDSTPDETEPPDDERTEGLQWAQAANTMTPAVGKVLTEKDARTVLKYMGAPVDPAEQLDTEDITEPPETPGEAPDPEDIAEPPEPMMGGMDG